MSTTVYTVHRDIEHKFGDILGVFGTIEAAELLAAQHWEMREQGEHVTVQEWKLGADEGFDLWHDGQAVNR